MIRRLFWISFTVVGLIGCSSTEPEPAAPPDVLGQYAGRFDFHYVDSDGVDGNPFCDCTIAIVSQTANRFTGNLELLAPCGGRLPFSGTIEVDGTIEAGFGYSLLGTACYKRVAPPLSGTISGGTISARTTEEYICPDTGLEATLDVVLTATLT